MCCAGSASADPRPPLAQAVPARAAGDRGAGRCAQRRHRHVEPDRSGRGLAAHARGPRRVRGGRRRGGAQQGRRRSTRSWSGSRGRRSTGTSATRPATCARRVRPGSTPVGVAWGWHEPQMLMEAGAERVAASPAELLRSSRRRWPATSSAPADGARGGRRCGVAAPGRGCSRERPSGLPARRGGGRQALRRFFTEAAGVREHDHPGGVEQHDLRAGPPPSPMNGALGCRRRRG